MSNPTYTQSAQELEGILERFRQETLPLEDALMLFESGVGHLKNCQAQLNSGRGQVEELIKTLGEDGQMVTQPFSPSS